MHEPDANAFPAGELVVYRSTKIWDFRSNEYDVGVPETIRGYG